MRQPQDPPTLRDPMLKRNLAIIGDLYGLTPAERSVVQFTVCMAMSRALKALVVNFGSVSLRQAAVLVAAATNLPHREVAADLLPSGRLVGGGLLAVDSSYPHALHEKIAIAPGIADLLHDPHLSAAEIVRRFLPEAPRASLTLADFDHLAGPVEHAVRLLRGALDRRDRGVNVLLYGPAGTGKTELARALAAALGVALYQVGATDEEGDAPNADERLAALRSANRLVGSTPALLLFDEIEDLFPPFAALFGRGANQSKQYFNDLLELNPAPTLWTTNRTWGIDRAFLRRFSYSIEVRGLGPRQRGRVLRRHLGEDGGLAEGEMVALAERYDASPGELASAVATARLAANGGRVDVTALEAALEAQGRLLGRRDPGRGAAFVAAEFDLDALNSPDDLAEIAERLAAWRGGQYGLTVCLFGPPGTGKSQYARWLAHRMGRRVIERRGSDLLDAFVGGTEKRIARAFREAEDEGDALLLLDEVDSLLRTRARALRSWEVTHVNEMLQQLESFRGVVVCTTNASLEADLDEAALRRFVFKAELRCLRCEQVVPLFGRYFARELAGALSEVETAAVREAIGGLENLATGDLAAVRRRLRALGGSWTAAQIAQLVRAETAHKQGGPATRGFGR